MIEFPAEFNGMVAALWNTYQPAIWIWIALMFSAVVILAFVIVAWNIIRRIV